MHHLAAHELEECGPLPCVLLGEQIHDSVAREGFPVETPCAREPRGSLATPPPGFPLATPPRFPGSAAARVLQAPPPGSIQIESPPPHHIDSPPPRHLVDATPASHRRRAGIPSPSAPASRLLCPGFPSLWRHLVVLVKPTIRRLAACLVPRSRVIFCCSWDEVTLVSDKRFGDC